MSEWFMIIFMLSISLFILLSIIFWSLHNGISPMPTSPKAKKIIISKLPKGVEGKVYELGSGWGTLLFPLASHYPQHKIIGYETSPIPFLFSKIRCILGGYKNVCILRKNFLEVPLNDAGLIVCYLYPGAMQKLKIKLEKELLAKTWVVSSTFSVPGWKPIDSVDIGDMYHSKVFIYRL